AKHTSVNAVKIAMRDSREGIGHLAVSCDMPRPDRVVVVIIIFAANREKLSQRRLDVSGFIDGTALNDNGFAVPMPWKPKSGQRPRQHRFLQPRFLPGFAIIDRDIDALDFAAAAPGDSADFVKPGRAKLLAARRPR